MPIERLTSKLEKALLDAIEQARASRQRDIALSLSMMLENLRRRNDEPFSTAPVADGTGARL